jgi:hypothetical protein
MITDYQQEIARNLDALRVQAYRDGFAEGLAIAEKILSWLSTQPDTKRQAMLRGWAEAEIERAKGST